MFLRNPLLPSVAMVAITAAVWVRLYFQRVGEMRTRGISPRDLATSQQAASVLKETTAADNFRNLFEVPILFHVLCLALYATRSVGTLMLAGLWAFVALRAVHSAIQCTYNRVMHRFYVYAASTILLFALWVAFGVEIL